jgi:hypothetical protein
VHYYPATTPAHQGDAGSSRSSRSSPGAFSANGTETPPPEGNSDEKPLGDKGDKGDKPGDRATSAETHAESADDGRTQNEAWRTQNRQADEADAKKRTSSSTERTDESEDDIFSLWLPLIPPWRRGPARAAQHQAPNNAMEEV